MHSAKIAALLIEYLAQYLGKAQWLSLGPAKVNTFSGPCYMIKLVPTFVSGIKKSVLVDFISQNKVKLLH